MLVAYLEYPVSEVFCFGRKSRPRGHSEEWCYSVLSFCKKFSEPAPEDEARLLVLVRSANDSAKDVERYFERTHGFFPNVHARANT
jgi:hypothetical protein